MRKIITILVLVLLTGCTNPAKLQTNIFGDLWDKLVVQEDEDIIKNTNTVLNSLNNYEKFAELNDKLDSLKEFLITGESFTAEEKIPLEKTDNKFYIKDLSKIQCVEQGNEKKAKCFVLGETQSLPVVCFDNREQELENLNQQIKYCEFREKTEFQEGLMKIADQNNENLINELRESFKIFNKSNLSKKSLEKELKKLKKNIDTVCAKQRTDIECGIK